MTNMVVESRVDMQEALELLASMIRIRRFEEKCAELYANTLIRGSMHLCNGQEAVAVGTCAALRSDDYITMTYRGHGQALAKGLDLVSAFAELLGRSTGSSRGLSGSMHFTDMSHGILGGNAIVAAGVPIAVGAAVSAQQQGQDRVAVAYFGEAATNQGSWHEALVLAAMWDAPVVLVCENNLWGEMTPYEATTRIEHLADRAAAYGFPGAVVDGNDVEAVLEATQEAVARARSGGGPTLLEMKTYRIAGHMFGDQQKLLPSEQVAYWKARDPIKTYRARLAERGMSEEDLEKVEIVAGEVIERAAAAAVTHPWPEPATIAGSYPEVP
jgi:acetoin:2,6-dichlorophenolindophenol oxidoreductase subunit alpha